MNCNTKEGWITKDRVATQEFLDMKYLHENKDTLEGIIKGTIEGYIKGTQSKEKDKNKVLNIGKINCNLQLVFGS
mgnify:CR=1 FL=1